MERIHESLPLHHVGQCTAAPTLDPELQEELGSHDSFLEYIDSMLMDETFEDSSWQLLAHNVGTLADPHNHSHDIAGKRPSSSVSLDDRYAHIFRGFHDILDESISNDLSVESIETNYGASYELMAEALDNPAELDVEKPEISDHLDVFEYNVLMIEAVSEMGRNKAPLREHKVHSDQQNAKEQHMEIMHTASSARQRVNAQKNISQSFVLSRSLKVAEGHDVSLVNNANLPAELYAQLFDEWPLNNKGAALSSGGIASRRRPRREGRRDEALGSLVDLKTLLLTSAKAVGDGNVKRAIEILQEIRQEGTSPYGSGLQRVVHYFSEALMARLSGMGNTLYKAIANTAQLPSPVMMLKAYKMVFEACPYVKIAYHFANQYILKAASGAARLHIVDYGILYGFQWPCLIYALAHRHGGPPHLCITGIEFPANAADVNPTATTEGTSRRLQEYAKTYNVPFEYHAISASKWEDVDASCLRISQDEVLVLNSFNRLGHIHDESITHPSPRDQLLKRMRSLNPHLLVTGSMNAAHSSPFFAPRFREAFYYYANMFDVFHTTMMNDSPERAMFERELMGRSILNVVACEGMERVELPETYKQWQTRITRAGFRQLTIIPSVLSTARAVMKCYHKDFDLLQDSNRWLLLGWRGRSMQALSAWEPSQRHW